MRSKIKTLTISVSARREFDLSRRFSNASFLESGVSRKTSLATKYLFNKSNASRISPPKRKFGAASTFRCFTSLILKSGIAKADDSTRKGSSEKQTRSYRGDDYGKSELDRNPKSEYNSSIFDDEIAGDVQYNKNRIWMDSETPLEQRVKVFLNQPLGSIHHLDIKLTSVDLIKACGKQKSFEGMKNAQEILDRLIEEKKYVNNSQEPKSFIIIPDRPFKMVMYGWANMCRNVKFAPQRMREVLDLMIQEAEYDRELNEKFKSLRIENESDSGDICANDDTDNKYFDKLYEGISCEPTVDTYNTLLQGLAQAATRSIQSAIEAEHALSKMDKMNATRGWHTKPNTRSYSLVLNAYAKCRHSTAGDRAEAVLRDMTERHENEKLKYFEEYGTEFDTDNPKVNKRNIVTPDTIAFTTVIKAYGHSNSSASAEKAFLLLNELICSDNPATQPDSFAFANTINAFATMAARKKSPSHRMEAAERAEEILWMMVDEIQKSQNSDHLSGSIVPFNACLNAWAESFLPESPHRAEDLLHRMLDPDLQATTNIQPNTVSFNTCMKAWAKACKFEKSAAPEKAEELLNLLIKLSNEDMSNSSSDNQWDLRPDTRSYVTVMNAYALSRKEDSAVQTRRLLLELIHEGRGIYFDSGFQGEMNPYPFTIVLKAAANVRTKDSIYDGSDERAFDSLLSEDEGVRTEDPYTIASTTYSELVKDTYDLGVRADHFAFAEMLAVVTKYTDKESIERRQRVEEVFQDACNAGQVSSLVVRAMQKACPNDIVLAELLRLRGNNTVASIETINMFPKKWTSRVPQEFVRVSSRKNHYQKRFSRKNNKSTNKANYGEKRRNNRN